MVHQSLTIIYKKFGIALCIGLIIFINACSDSDDVKDLPFEVIQTTLQIKVDSLGLDTYAAEPAIFQKAGEYYLYAYNRPYSSLDVYNLNQQRFINRIPISREGPNRVNKHYQTLVKSPDSVYILGARILYLLNSNGKVVNKHKLQFDATSQTDEGSFNAANEAIIDLQGTSLRGFFLRPNSRDSKSLNQPMLAAYDIATNRLSFLPIPYSDFIKNNNGDFAEIRPNLTFIGDKVYYNFPIESNIYSYDFKEEQITKHEAESQFSQNRADRQSLNIKYNYYNEGTWFKRLQPYPGQPYFYRAHWGSQAKKTPSGNLTDASTKPGYIMIFDNQLNVIDEFKLDDNCYIDGNFATDEGIFFWAKDGLNENEMKLCQYILKPTSDR